MGLLEDHIDELVKGNKEGTDMVDFAAINAQNKLKREHAEKLAKPVGDLVNMALKGDALRQELINSIGKHLAEQLIDCGIVKTCLNCDHWNTDGTYGTETAHNPKFPEGCVKFQRMPPPKVIVVGCKDHSDQIPF